MCGRSVAKPPPRSSVLDVLSAHLVLGPGSSLLKAGPDPGGYLVPCGSTTPPDSFMQTTRPTRIGLAPMPMCRISAGTGRDVESRERLKYHDCFT